MAFNLSGWVRRTAFFQAALLVACLVCGLARAGDSSAPSNGDVIRSALLPDGDWWYEHTDADSGRTFDASRRKPLPQDSGPLCALLRAEWPDAGDIDIADHPALSAKIAHPANHFEFRTDAGAVLHCGIAVYCDDWTFIFSVIAERPDAADDDAIKAEIEAALLDLDFLVFDEPPFQGTVKVYMTAPDSSLAPGMDVMTALIRLKRLADPEKGLEHAFDRLAYRYDGVGDSGEESGMHLFSFGTDSPEKFTAESHFGVDASGTVYRMDIFDEGKYKPVARPAESHISLRHASR